MSRVGKNNAIRKVGDTFFGPNFIFYKLECTGGKSKKKKKKNENRKKKVPVGPFSPPAHPAGGQERMSYLRMA